MKTNNLSYLTNFKINLKNNNFDNKFNFQIQRAFNFSTNE